MRKLLIVLVVLVVLLVAADRVAAYVAQRQVADQVAAELASNQIDSEPPEVTFNRVPFLTQVAAGEYRSVTLRLREVGSGPLRLPMVELTATGVAAPASAVLSGDGEIVADRVDGTATVGYASVADATGVDGLELSPADGGALRVRLPADLAAEFLDTPVTLVGVADVSVAEGTVQVRIQELTVEDSSQLPPGTESVVSELVQRMSVDVALPPLPYGLTVESVRAGSAGLEVEVSARDVPLTS